jgi:hypothetical protein
VNSFEFNGNEKVSLKVSDNQGRFKRSLLDNTMHASKHELSWHGGINQAESVSAGTEHRVIKMSKKSLG